ncbi:MAG TPA: nitrate ABC transporter substrate-binding protein [Planctomycetaceae bacterium]|nr:nitrate ABC transporter substrate-binding protein [Planctomycetaceae bacterium]
MYNRTPLILGFASLLLITFAGCGNSKITIEELEAAALAVEAKSQSTRSDAGEVATNVVTTTLDIEKPKIKLGFIKLTDCAPLVIAKEKGFFDDEGLQVELEAQSNWKVLLDRVVDGQLDGAHMLAGQPIGATIGIGTKADVITAYSLNYNGNAITVSNDVWSAMQQADGKLADANPPRPVTASPLRPIVDRFKAEAKDFNMGIVFPVSTHNYELRYWLAAGGIHPGLYTADDINGMTGAEVLLSVTPPPQMPSTMEAGTIQGYCVGEPWNQAAIAKGIGLPVVTNLEIWKDNPEKVLGVMKSWDKANPNTHVAIIKALIRAGKWLDEKDASGKFVNREETTSLLSMPNYVGADREVIAAGMTGTYRYQKSEVKQMPGFILFFDAMASYPHYSDCIWFLTQMRRWGQIGDSKPDAWYESTAKSVYQPSIYRRAAELLVAEGLLSSDEFPEATYDGYRAVSSEFIDKLPFDARAPVAYINSFQIGNKDTP